VPPPPFPPLPAPFLYSRRIIEEAGGIYFMMLLLLLLLPLLFDELFHEIVQARRKRGKKKVREREKYPTAANANLLAIRRRRTE
jgi:hypothetical protein